jgi:hypothetical protein
VTSGLHAFKRAKRLGIVMRIAILQEHIPTKPRMAQRGAAQPY